MKRLKIPYGDANFEQIRTQNYLYVDKTKYIKLIENEPKYIFFIRPRRFGKSLFISMLESYYDINQKDRFEQLFGNLYIGKNPTPERNSYMVLSLDFSGIVTGQGIERFYDSLDDYIASSVNTFIKKYKALIGVSELPQNKYKAEKAITFLTDSVKAAGQKIYILIDEYDNFANDLIRPIHETERSKLNYKTIINSEGYLRTFYKKLKVLTKTASNRLFMTGVSPIMLDDLASGFNITTNITIERDFNEMLGFTEDEAIDILKQTGIDDDELKQIMQSLHYYYDGYLFAEEATKRIFNSDMFLYFLQHYQKYKRYPKQILDNNVKTDYGKIQALAFNFKDQETIDQLMKNGEVSGRLVERFELKKMYDNRDNFISLLFYLGMLTIKGYNTRGKLILQIPNYVSRKIYWEYFTAHLRKTSDLRTNDIIDRIDILRNDGNIEPFIEYVQQVLEKLSNRDLQKLDEKYIKVVMFTLLDIDGFYLLESEPELRNGYADLLLTRSVQFAQFIKYEWLIELKYIKESERDQLDAIRKKGIEQLKNYTESENIKKRFEDKSIKKALVCFIGKGEAVVDNGQPDT